MAAQRPPAAPAPDRSVRGPLPGRPPHPDGDLLDRLRGIALDVLRSHLPAPAPYALLDFPYYPNVGDHAIWRGTLAALAALGWGRPAYAADLWNYSPRALRRRIGNGPILLQGGGNLGDLWPAHQRHREAVLRSHPHNAVIQLPQSVEFRTADAQEQARAAFAAHPRFSLLIRDARSAQRARDALGREPVMCPDLALCAPRSVHLHAGRGAVRLLLRDDPEGAGAAASVTVPGERVDWADWQGLLERHGTRLARRVTQRLPGAQNLVHLTFEALSRRRLGVGRRLLAGASAVVTDRLHGHVLCLLAGVPHVLLGDRYGKVAEFHETWTREAMLCRFVAHPREVSQALATLRERFGTT
jgi:exopolysaccharide biosynthesis predicted pyruvyltransferase EpsI